MIAKVDNFTIYKPAAIDPRFVSETLAARDLITPDYRYEGLINYCEEDQTLYLLQGGIDNVNWVAIGGSGGASTIDANRPISLIPDGTNLGATYTLAEFLEACFFYGPVGITSFTGGTTLEKGEDTLIRQLAYTVTEPSNDYVIASIVITGSDGYNSGDIKSGPNSQSGVHNITLITDTDTTYTLTVTSTQAGVYATATTSFVFRNKTWWGAKTVPLVYDDAFIKSLTNGVSSPQFDADYSRSFTVTAGAGEYIYYAVPKDYTVAPYIKPPYFFVGGFQGGFVVAANDVMYTYEGNTEAYIIYKSTNANLGLTTVTVQST